MSDANTVDDTIVWNDIKLFGGAISCRLPMGYMDLANMRQVPDHQECYMEVHLDNKNSSNNHNNNSDDEKPSSVFIMEILEQQQHVEHDRILEYLFRDLAESNGIVVDGAGNNNVDTVMDDDDHHTPRIVLFQSDGIVNSNVSTRPPGIRPPHALFQLGQDSAMTGSTHRKTATVVYRSGRGVQRIRRGKDRSDISNQNCNDNMETISIQMFVIRLLEQTTDLFVTLTTPIVGDVHNVSTETLQTQQQQQTILFQQMISSIQIHDLTLFTP